MPRRINPTSGQQRIELLDALRGFALLGVLMVNLRSLSLYGLLPRHARDALPTAPLDRILAAVNAALVDGAFITMFTLLFGVGFSMHMQRARNRPDGVALYVRRLMILFAIGAVHAWLFWWGDILRYYALLGLLLIPMAQLPAKVLAWGGVIVVLLVPLVLQPVVPDLLPSQVSSRESADAALVAFASRDWSEVLQGNLTRDLRMRIAVWVLPTYILGRLMIGAAIGRSGVLSAPDAHLRFWRRSCGSAAIIAGSIIVFTLLRKHSGLIDGIAWWDGVWGKALLQMSGHAAPLALGWFYLSGCVLLFQGPRWRRVLCWLSPVGRMALTNYLGQTLIAIGLFYGVGLGLGPRYGLAGATIAAAVIFLAQAAASRWWLSRFRFGPLEWLWRSLTYRQVQPMRRLAGPAQAGSP